MTRTRGVALLVVAGLVFAAGAVGLGRVRMASNEAAAVGALRTIVEAQAAYAAGCGGGAYARSLQDLGTPPPGRERPYLEGELARWPTPLVDGYLFNIRQRPEEAGAPEDCNGFPTQTSYYAVAVPVRVGETGARSFATNERGVIWEREGPAPAAEPFGPPAVRVE